MEGNRRINQLLRELNYYRREFNDLGARLLRMQEEQSRTFREARRSRTVVKLIREAYRLADQAVTPEEIGPLMAEIVLENTMCDKMAILRQFPEDAHFTVTHALGFADEQPPTSLAIPAPPPFLFTTADTKLEPPAFEISQALRVPYILWAFDPGTGFAMIVGNKTESNIHRPFETGDHELIEGALSVYIDILTKKQAESDLIASRAEAENAHRSQTNLLKTLNEGILTPVSHIMEFSEILQKEELSKLPVSDFHQYTHKIIQESAYIIDFVKDVSKYTELEKNGPALIRKRVDLVSLMHSSFKHIKYKAEDKKVWISVVIMPTARTIVVDPDSIREVLILLLDNAVKFTPPGGQVVATAGEMDGNRNAVFRIQDDGIGIQKEDLPLVFEPFVKVENLQRDSGAGKGLGLSIAKVLVEAHGGTIVLESEPGKGTTAVVRLPSEAN